MRFTRAFTLVEILVILAVVAILATVVLGNIGEARKVARDKERMAMLDQISLALRLYKEQYGLYPSSGCYPESVTFSCWVGNDYASNIGSCAAHSVACDEYIDGIEDLLSPLPQDPRNQNWYGYIYRVTSDRTSYKMMAWGTVESEVITTADNPYAMFDASCESKFTDGSSDTKEQRSYAVWYDPNPGDGAGAECW